MQARNHTLMALALGAALASPTAFAGNGKVGAAKPTAKAGQSTAGSVMTGERPASPTLPTQSDPRASDAIAARAAKQAETMGDAVDTDTNNESNGVADPNLGTTSAGAANLDASTRASSRTTNPGKGNWWLDADTDGDGRISTTEAAANAGLGSRFGTVDANKDGFVTQDEYRSFFAANASQGAAHAAAHSAVVTRDVWLKLDTDTDSKISLAEAASNAALTTSFATVDSNSDGFVTQDEYTAYAKANMSKK